MITLRQLRLLSEAITMASEWRGNLIGAAPQEDINDFDMRILEMRLALKAARKDREVLGKLDCVDRAILENK